MPTAAFTFIGVIEDSVGRGGGAELASRHARTQGILDALGAIDAGDIDSPIRGDDRDWQSGIVALADVLRMTGIVRTTIAARVGKGERPFVMGGCCASAVGAIAGARDALARLSLVYVDGHQDLYDGRTSDTGEAADMPFATVLGLGPEPWVAVAGGASVSPTHAWLVGFSDHEEAISAGAREAADVIPPDRVYPAPAIRVLGAEQVSRVILATIGQESTPFWLHLDVDVLDGSIFPATNYPAHGGLGWSDLEALLRPLVASSLLAGISAGCYNPEKDPDGACGRAFVDLWRDLSQGVAPRQS